MSKLIGPWPSADDPAWGNARVEDPHDPNALPLGRLLGMPGYEPRAPEHAALVGLARDAAVALLKENGFEVEGAVLIVTVPGVGDDQFDYVMSCAPESLEGGLSVKLARATRDLSLKMARRMIELAPRS